MALEMKACDYVEYLKVAYEKIHANGDYVTELDSATGDGDHWSNINMGFEKLVESEAELKALEIPALFQKIGMTMMSVIGGSSGVLYGSAYIGAAKALAGVQVLTAKDLCTALDAMAEAIAKRGGAKPGDKTMLDALAPAVDCFKTGLDAGMDEHEMFAKVRQAAVDGAERTKAMEAVWGRAVYQANKGVGHLDPGAVTMAYQIESLMDYALSK